MPDLDPLLIACDAAALRIKTVWNPGAPDTCKRRFLLHVDVGQLVGRHVAVFPDSYEKIEDANRDEDINEYTMVVLTVERYSGEGKPPDEWVEARMLFVRRMVFDVLKDPREPAIVEGYQCVAPSVPVPYDAGRLEKDMVFWSEARFAFRAEETP